MHFLKACILCIYSKYLFYSLIVLHMHRMCLDHIQNKHPLLFNLTLLPLPPSTPSPFLNLDSSWCCLQAEWVWAIHRVWVAYQMPHSWRKMAPLPQKVVTNCLAWTEPHEASPVHDGRLWTSHAGSTADGGSWVRQPCPTRKTAHSPPPSCRLSTGCCVNAHEGPSNWKSLALSTLTG